MPGFDVVLARLSVFTVPVDRAAAVEGGEAGNRGQL